MVAPLLIAVAPYRGSTRERLRWVLAFTPLVAWELFSVLYYGFPFPNTAYAKLKTGIAERELLVQGAT